MVLLERQAELEALQQSWREARAGTGELVLVMGEAGVGKSALVETFVAALAPGPRVAWGYCDALQTPRTLGPVHELAMALEVATRGDAAADPPRERSLRDALFSGLFAELAREGPGTLVVLEDLHWADGATLDFVRFLGRRIQRLGCLFIATYRDDEVHGNHPLRRTVGALTGDHTRRLRLSLLSEQAVAELAGPGRDGAHVYAVTGGNPFFVRELLRAGRNDVPQTVRDAVVGRLLGCSANARRVAELVSVNPGPTETWLVEAVCGPTPDALEELASCGLLVPHDTAWSFRHELARLAVESTLTHARAEDWHRQVLEVLVDHDGDLARLVHHADRARCTGAVLEHAPRAGDEAAALGSHREAAAHYATALQFCHRLPAAQRAALYERHAAECNLTNRAHEATRSARQALTLWREVGDAAAQARALRLLSRQCWERGDQQGAHEAARQAVELLETQSPGPDLAMAYSVVSQLAMLDGRTQEALEYGTRALDLARRFRDHATESHALNNLGAAKVACGETAGFAELEQALAVGLAHGLSDQVGRAYANLVSCSILRHDLERAERYLEAGVRYCDEHEIHTHLAYLRAYAARFELDRGCWDEAARLATGLLEGGDITAVQRIPTLVTLALVRIRRGDPGVDALLEEAWRLAIPTGELQRIGRVAAARAERAWYQGDDAAAAREAALGLRHAEGHHDPWIRGELVWWHWRAAGGVPPTEGIAEPYRHMVNGEAVAAARIWERLGMRYQQALALSGGDEAAMLEALPVADALGAAPLADRVRRRLRREGVRGVPRGPRAATQANPAGLTPRELQVLQLLARGHSNAELARRLHLSPRTIHRHVSAILAKLEVRTRGEAAAAAFAMALVDPPT